MNQAIDKGQYIDQDRLSPRQQRERAGDDEQTWVNTKAPAPENMEWLLQQQQQVVQDVAQDVAGDQLRPASGPWTTKDTEAVKQAQCAIVREAEKQAEHLIYDARTATQRGGIRACTPAEEKVIQLKQRAHESQRVAQMYEKRAVLDMRGAAFLIEHPEFVEFLQLQREGIL